MNEVNYYSKINDDGKLERSSQPMMRFRLLEDGAKKITFSSVNLNHISPPHWLDELCPLV